MSGPAHSKMISKTTFLVADSNEVYLTGLNRIVNEISKKSRLCSAQNSQEIITLIQNLSFDIIISERDLLGKQLEVLKAARSRNPKIKILALGFNDDLSNVIGFMKSGGNGFLEKDTCKQEIASAINDILEEKKYLSKNIQIKLSERSIAKRNNILEEYSSRKNGLFREMLFLLIHECTSKEIAYHLKLGERTVEKYRSDLIRETGAKNMIGLIKFALRNNLEKDKMLSRKYRFSNKESCPKGNFQVV